MTTHRILRRGEAPLLQDEGDDEIDKRKRTMIEFFFDCSSPWTYLAFHNIQPMATALGEEIRGGRSWSAAFSTPSTPASMRRASIRCRPRGLCEERHGGLGALAGLKIKMPPTVFPVNSVKAMRGCLFLDWEGSCCRSRAQCSRPIGATIRTSRRTRR